VSQGENVKSERIAVTGVGMVTALGPSALGTFERLMAGERGFSRVTLFDVEGHRSQIAAELKGLKVVDIAPPGGSDAWSRSDAMALLAAREALNDAKLRPRDKPLSVVCGSSTGGMFEAETVLASMQTGTAPEATVRRLLSYPLSTSIEHLADAFAPVERAVTVCSACSSGAVAMVQAAAWLITGRAERVLAGGTDGLCLLTFAGFNALSATDPKGCRPFDVDRAGLTLGEGSGFMVLELESAARARGAEIRAFLSGWSVGAEAHHITHPEPSGQTAARLLRAAMRHAELTPADIDYVNAHGTGTQHNDATEALALHQALGDETRRIFVSSSKGQIGHALAAAGALEAGITVMALERAEVPPTGGLQNPERAHPLRHVCGNGERASLRAALSSSFGFGGTGCVLCFEHPDAPRRGGGDQRTSRVAISGAVSFGPLGARSGVENALYAASGQEQASAEIDAIALLDPSRSRRFDRAAAFASAGAARLLQNCELSGAETGLVAGTAFGNVQRSVDFVSRVVNAGPKAASPAEFPHLVPSAPSGNASVYAGLTGPVVSVSDLSTSAEAAVAVALGFLELGLAERMVAGSAEPADPIVQRVLGPMHRVTNPERLSLPQTGADTRKEGSAWLLLEREQALAERGAEPLALIDAMGHGWGETQVQLPGVKRADRAAVVTATPIAERELLLRNSSWSKAPAHDVSPVSGSHEGAGGFALATAAALIARGEVDQVLVCSVGRQRHFFFHLVSVAFAASKQTR
jgi:3-oxoacyl-[acyl-carrier-protein] synthase II